MAYILVGVTNEVIDVFLNDPGGGVLLTDEQANEIATSRFGHSVYDYISGELVVNQVRYTEIAASIVIRNVRNLALVKYNRVVTAERRDITLIRVAFLFNKKVEGTITAPENDKLNSLLPLLERINNLDIALDVIEAEILISNDPEVIDLENHVAWPE